MGESDADADMAHVDSDAQAGMTRGLYSTRPAAPADESNIPPRGRARAEYSKP